MTKWRKIDQTLSNKEWIGIRREPKGEEGRSNPANGPFWSKQQNVAKYGARLRVWRATESDGDGSQMACVANGTRGYTAAPTATTTTTTTTVLFLVFASPAQPAFSVCKMFLTDLQILSILRKY
jgi:hypothetical protein